MGEKIREKTAETLLPKPEEEKMLPEGEHEKLLEAGHNQSQEQLLEAARNEASSEATKSEKSEALKTIESSVDTEDSLPDERASISKDLKHIVKKRELESIQRREFRRDRVLSKIVHQPVIRVLSEAASTTVSRPSGMLGGGLVALIGTCGYYYLSLHIGLKYNYSIFLLLFAGGFVVGVTLELALRILATSRRRNI
jgi:hypothetical protein